MSTETSIEHNYGQKLALPPHVQRVDQALRLNNFLNYVETVVSAPLDESDDSDSDSDLDILKPSERGHDGNKVLNGITITKSERKADKTRLYNFTKVKKNRKWIKNILLSDSSSDEDEEPTISNEDLQEMLKVHRCQRKYQMQFYQDPELHQFQYYSTGLLSNYDKFPEHNKLIAGPKKKISKEHKKMERKMKAKMKRLKKEQANDGSDMDDSSELDPKILEAILSQRQQGAKGGKNKKLTPEQADTKRRKIWISLSKKEIPKAQKQKASARKEMLSQLKKCAQQCMKESRRKAIQSQKVMKETSQRAKRLTREMMVYWKRFEKVEKEHRKKAEKEAQEQRKIDLELREARRQQRKLNFLITQTELYAHFMARKLTGATDANRDAILAKLDERRPERKHEVTGGLLVDEVEDDFDSERYKEVALRNAEKAYQSHQARRQAFDYDATQKIPSKEDPLSFANPSLGSGVEKPQPTIFEGKLKGYQLKGMNWLANLYNQGINGILADEMGLGKTVQSIAFLAHLSEYQGIWGPFLIIAPASTLHNWQQECARFLPRFKVVPYWGNTQDRRILRKFWDQKCLHTEEASFHVVITSYQLVIQDVKYFQRIKWQYMVLDEAQAIKSSSSVRWKILLGFNCRNRLLLTGTPIQNSMAELWALLHFIMPTMFDSHDEFNEWFSKDIESHVERQSGIDENQLSRLHMILKPFMLRRVKKDVENELSDKIEILVYCPLTTRQRLLYQAVKNKISIEDLISSTSHASQAQSTTSSLMNLVMQFRKVCNHPELFERREIRSPFYMRLDPYVLPKLLYREGLLESSLPSRDHILLNRLYIFSPEHIHHSLFPPGHKEKPVHSFFSFLRFVNVSPSELSTLMLAGLLVRWLAVFLWLKTAYRIHHEMEWREKTSSHRANQRFLLEPVRTTYFTNIHTSPTLSQIVFTSPNGRIVSHETHVIHFMPETISHRQIRLKHLRAAALAAIQHHGGAHGTAPHQGGHHSSQHGSHSPKKSPLSPPHSPNKALDMIHLPVHTHKLRASRVMKCQPTSLPRYLHYGCVKTQVEGRAVDWVSSDRSAAWDNTRRQLVGSLKARNSLLYGTPDLYTEARWPALYFQTRPPGGLVAACPVVGWSSIHVPDKETLITDAGKLYVLDSLLQRLKDEGHRVLIYSQMTRMIDILEEYMWFRKHTYMRLDGSSKISDRRDMVADFQARSDIFVFLLSTRAGGLGINLTAADTVIFYDSDWNPTVDQQAMDRAHRLGQTKQVTVYRLVCKGTIEERILQRAKEKSEIQRMVISGGNFRPDTLKPKEVVSLLIDDEEMEHKLKQRQGEKTIKEENYKEKDRKRKREKYAEKVRKKEGKRGKHENNLTIPAPDTESVASLDSVSLSMPASPQSEMSFGSEINPLSQSLTHDDSSNDALVIVDDSLNSFPPVNTSTPTSTSKRGSGRGRGRPRGSTVGRRPRGRGGAKKALSAAEIAGAQAGMTAAYRAYGYKFTGKSRGGRGSRSDRTQNAPFKDSV